MMSGRPSCNPRFGTDFPSSSVIATILVTVPRMTSSSTKVSTRNVRVLMALIRKIPRF